MAIPTASTQGKVWDTENQSWFRRQSQLFTVEITDFCKDGYKAPWKMPVQMKGSEAQVPLPAWWEVLANRVVAHDCFGRWKRGRGPLFLCQRQLLKYQFQWQEFCDGSWALYSWHHCVDKAVGQLCGSSSSFLQFCFLACFNVISILISNMQKGKEYNSMSMYHPPSFNPHSYFAFFWPNCVIC